MEEISLNESLEVLRLMAKQFRAIERVHVVVQAAARSLDLLKETEERREVVIADIAERGKQVEAHLLAMQGEIERKGAAIKDREAQLVEITERVSQYERKEDGLKKSLEVVKDRIQREAAALSAALVNEHKGQKEALELELASSRTELERVQRLLSELRANILGG